MVTYKYLEAWRPLFAEKFSDLPGEPLVTIGEGEPICLFDATMLATFGLNSVPRDKDKNPLKFVGLRVSGGSYWIFLEDESVAIPSVGKLRQFHTKMVSPLFELARIIEWAINKRVEEAVSKKEESS